MPNAVKITKEDELLLEKYSRAASRNSNKLIYVNALFISLIPIWLYWRVHNMPLLANSILYVTVSLVSAFLLSMAYKNSKGPLMDRVANRRAEAITKEINSQAGKDKSITRKDREDAIRERTREVADYESTAFSIFYNNCLFLLALMLLTAMLNQLSSQVSYFLSMCTAAAATWFLSSGQSSF